MFSERIVSLVGEFVCKNIGLGKFVSDHPDIISQHLIDGKKIIDIAVLTQDEELVQLVLDAGSQKNAPLDGCSVEVNETSLHRAVSTNNLNLAKKLLGVGVDPTVVNSIGQTPSNLGRQLGLTEITNFLASAEVEWVEKKKDFDPKNQVGAENSENSEEDWSDFDGVVWGTGNLSLCVKVPHNTPAERELQSFKDKERHRVKVKENQFVLYKKYFEGGKRSAEMDKLLGIEDYELWSCQGEEDANCPHPKGWHEWIRKSPV